MDTTRRATLAALAATALSPALEAFGQSGAPLRIGSSMALTGPLGPAGLVHKLVGDIYVDDLNARGGLLGRKVEWIVRDDQSRPDITRTIYEQLITSDKVDLIMGPYATGAILSAMAVAQRYNKVLIHNSFGTPQQAKYDMQFSTGGLSYDVEVTIPKLVFDAVGSAAKPPQSVAIATSKFPSVHFISVGAREAAKKRGIKEVAFLEWDFGNRDFGAIAARIRDAKPDFLYCGSLGIETTQLIDAMSRIDYTPPLQFHTFPAVGPMMKLPGSRNALALTVFEEHSPFTDSAVASQFVKTYKERATKLNFPDTSVDLQAGIEFAAWQVLEAAITATKSIDDKTLAQWLKKNQVDTVIGRQRWDGPNNYIVGSDNYKVKQLQDGKWLVVWPKEYAAPGAKLIG